MKIKCLPKEGSQVFLTPPKTVLYFGIKFNKWLRFYELSLKAYVDGDNSLGRGMGLDRMHDDRSARFGGGPIFFS